MFRVKLHLKNTAVKPEESMNTNMLPLLALHRPEVEQLKLAATLQLQILDKRGHPLGIVFINKDNRVSQSIIKHWGKGKQQRAPLQ
mmetsp:Transcript_19301/g.54037  ORF Transcript_19301/g.54037 Transcript_19301/m.54037 type:complete len:86 (-) Transcript_19301:664-921(-)